MFGGNNMISTSSYKNWKSNLYDAYSISGDRGKKAEYCGKYYSKLAPKLSFWKKWYDNIGIVSEEENNKYYIEEMYDKVLSKLDPEEVYRELDYSILLCYEDNESFCHRHIVAEWFQLLLDVKVPEVKLNGSKFEEIERPKYIGEYLEYIMKKNKNMRGFNSLHALYLFEKGEKLEQIADDFERETGSIDNFYRQEACYLRSNADMEEEKYNKNKLVKVKIKR